MFYAAKVESTVNTYYILDETQAYSLICVQNVSNFTEIITRSTTLYDITYLFDYSFFFFSSLVRVIHPNATLIFVSSRNLYLKIYKI